MHQYQFSLVLFTVLTQWSIGCLLALTAYRTLAPESAELKYSKQIALFIWGLCVVGSLSSLKHLGNPLQAYYALRGLSHSWMSREVVAFGMLNGLMTLWMLSHFLETRSLVQKVLGIVTSVFGLTAVVVAGQIYFMVEHQPEWNTVLTHLGFIGTTLLLGVASLTAMLKLSKQTVPTTFRYLLGACVLFVFAIIVQLSQITGTSNLLWFRVFASIMAGVTLFMLAGSVSKQPTVLFVLATLLMVSGEIAGRMSFFSSVMAKVPW